MNALEEKLYVELRQTEQEVMASLKRTNNKQWLKAILEDELADIRTAIGKMETGCFGMCEISGELFPKEILKTMPTVKSKQDVQMLDKFYRMPLH